MSKLLTLDLATKTGWACAPPDVATVQDIRHGTVKFPVTGDDIGRFIAAYDEWLNGMFDLEKPTLVVFEAPLMRNSKTTIATVRKLMGLASHTEFVCSKRSIEVREMNLATVKKSFAGHGRAEKHQMIAAAKLAGFDVKDDNDADACALWVTSLSMYWPRNHSRLFGMGALGGR